MIERVAQMLVDGCLAHAQLGGDLLEPQPLPGVEQDDFSADGRSELSDAILQRFDLAFKRLAVTRGLVIYRKITHGALTGVMRAHHIQASVANA